MSVFVCNTVSNVFALLCLLFSGFGWHCYLHPLEFSCYWQQWCECLFAYFSPNYWMQWRNYNIFSSWTQYGAQPNNGNSTHCRVRCHAKSIIPIISLLLWRSSIQLYCTQLKFCIFFVQQGWGLWWMVWFLNDLKPRRNMNRKCEFWLESTCFSFHVLIVGLTLLGFM